MVSEPKQPWWQTTRTPKPGFWLGGFWLLFGLYKWLTLDPDDGLSLTMACLFTLLGAAYVASSIALLRRRATHAEP